MRLTIRPIIVLVLVVSGIMAGLGAQQALSGQDQSEVKSVSPQEAWQLYQELDGAVILDVRTRAEFVFVGHPKGAVNIPLLYWDEMKGQMVPNPDFMSMVEARFSKDTPLIVICRSGGRSLRAAMMLKGAGYKTVINVAEGFEGKKDKQGKRTIGGWKNADLPWEY